jgi:hypothetical protein
MDQKISVDVSEGFFSSTKIAVLFFMVVLFFIGSVVFFLLSRSQQFSKGSVLVVPTIAATPAITQNPTASWKPVTLDNVTFKIPFEWWIDGPITASKGTWININPEPLPVPGNVPPAFIVMHDVKSITEKKQELSAELSNIQELSLPNSALEGILLEGTTKAGYTPAHKIKIALVLHNSQLYFIQELNTIASQDTYFGQIVSTFTFSEENISTVIPTSPSPTPKPEAVVTYRSSGNDSVFVVAGRVFSDENCDQLKDSSEKGLGNFTVKISKLPDLTPLNSVQSSADGSFSVTLPRDAVKELKLRLSVVPITGFASYSKPNPAVGAVTLTEKDSSAFANLPQLSEKDAKNCK